MMWTLCRGSSRAIIFGTACLLSTAAALAATQADGKGHELAEVDEAYVNATGTLTRCGEYFLLETKSYGEVEVKQLHLTYALDGGGVAMEAKPYRTLEVVIDDAKETPTLHLKWENPGLENDRLELSRTSYEEARACVPPPRE